MPASPAIANLIGLQFDQKIKEVLPALCTYTRYADDITISGHDITELKRLRGEIPNILKSCGFEANHKKTRIQSALFGRIRITGITISGSSFDGTGQVHVPRKVKRRLRAILHQLKLDPTNKILQNRAKGLIEWCKLREPAPNSHYKSKVIKAWVKDEMKSANLKTK